MKILVCISNVPDTTTKIKLAADRKSVDTAGIQWVINPWDELALTRALELKETSGGTIEKVSVATVGTSEVEPTLRKALAIGADDAFRVDANPADAYQAAAELAAMLKVNPYDIILCGIESSDYNGSAFGGMLAELLETSSVSSVSSLSIAEGQLLLTREIDGGKETLASPIPLVAIVQKGISIEARIPSMRGIMTARSKPLLIIPACGAASLTSVSVLDLPAPKAACQMVDAENAAELVRLLHQKAKVI